MKKITFIFLATIFLASCTSVCCDSKSCCDSTDTICETTVDIDKLDN